MIKKLRADFINRSNARKLVGVDKLFAYIFAPGYTPGLAIGGATATAEPQTTSRPQSAGHTSRKRFTDDVIFTIITKQGTGFIASITVVWGNVGE